LASEDLQFIRRNPTNVSGGRQYANYLGSIAAGLHLHHKSEFIIEEFTRSSIVLGSIRVVSRPEKDETDGPDGIDLWSDCVAEIHDA
jgi:hypothetical protein